MLPIVGASPEAFMLNDHQSVWEAIVALNADGVPTDIVMVSEWLHKHGMDVSAVYLSELSGVSPTSMNAPHYAREVHETHLKRDLYKLSKAIEHDVWHGGTSGTDMAARARARLDVLAQDTTVRLRKLSIESADDWRTKAAEPVPWLIQDWCARKTVSVLAAAGGTGKSVFTLGLALQVAMGTADIFPALAPKERGTVLMVDLEDTPENTWRIIGAYAECYGLGAYLDETLQNRFRLVPGRGGGFVVAAPPHGLQTTEMYAEFRSVCKTEMPDLIIVNHLRKIAGNASGNSNEDMGVVMSLLDEVAFETEAAVIVLAHTAKAATTQGPRGASSITDEARLVMSLDVDDTGTLLLSRTKANNAPKKHDPIPFRFQPAGQAVCLRQDGYAAAQPNRDDLVQSVARWLGMNPEKRVNARRLQMGDGAVLLEDIRAIHPHTSLRILSEAVDAGVKAGLFKIKKEWDALRHQIWYIALTSGTQQPTHKQGALSEITPQTDFEMPTYEEPEDEEPQEECPF